MRSPPSLSAVLISSVLALMSMPLLAQPTNDTTPATGGCPLFKCTPEATGVMSQQVVQTPSRMTKNSALGTMKAQGCSGDGDRMACLFVTDTVAGTPGRGTLKLLNGTTLQPVWGSGDSPNSYNLQAATAAGGQVPYLFANGRIAAGDGRVHALYEADGRLVSTVALAGRGSNLGLTPVGGDLGVVSQTDGVLTLINMANWSTLGSLILRDPTLGTQLPLVTPSSSSGGTLYAVAGSSNNVRSFLFTVHVDPTTKRLKQRARFEFIGKTGASPVVVTPAQTGLAGNLVLLHAPSLAGDTAPQNRLLGLLDSGARTISLAWSIPLTEALRVAPTIDTATQTLFFSYGPDARVYQHGFVDGSSIRSFDIRALGGFPSGFALNGHLAATQSPAGFSLLLSGSVIDTPGSTGQYLMAFRPDVSGMIWIRRTQSRADSYTGAWSLVPSLLPGAACPVVMGLPSGLTRVCDF